MKNQEKISGIHNYCDRWCERCKFTAQCAIFDENEKSSDITDEQFFESLHEIFANTLKMIKETVEEAGEDWDTFVEEAKNTEIKEPEFTDHQKSVIDLSASYHKTVQDWFASNKDYLYSKENEYTKSLEMGIDIMKKANEILNAIDVIQWYLYFINVKIVRAFTGLNGNVEIFDGFEEDPIQNDNNGSAKIAKIAIDNSIAAWEVLYKHFPEKADEILDILVILSKTKKGLMKELPDLDKFIRPGFDE